MAASRLGSGEKGYWAHATAIVDEPAQIGEGTRVWHFSHVMAGARIGARCVLGQNVFVASRAVLGDGCKIQNNVSLYDDVELADDVFVAPSAVFTNVINPRAFIERKHEYLKTRVGRGASIGANATVVCGHDIGEYAFVGAGAVVTKSVPAYGLVTVVPARLVGWMCRCGVRLPKGSQPTCGACGTAYAESTGGDGVRALAPREAK
jgi:UDP-2-acetamido-3-amino-2,3-dideoxy-glucuronate N-acetyltransferase